MKSLRREGGSKPMGVRLEGCEEPEEEREQTHGEQNLEGDTGVHWAPQAEKSNV